MPTEEAFLAGPEADRMLWTLAGHLPPGGQLAHGDAQAIPEPRKDPQAPLGAGPGGRGRHWTPGLAELLPP